MKSIISDVWAKISTSWTPYLDIYFKNLDGIFMYVVKYILCLLLKILYSYFTILKQLRIFSFNSNSFNPFWLLKNGEKMKILPVFAYEPDVFFLISGGQPNSSCNCFANQQEIFNFCELGWVLIVYSVLSQDTFDRTEQWFGKRK